MVLNNSGYIAVSGGVKSVRLPICIGIVFCSLAFSMLDCSTIYTVSVPICQQLKQERDKTFLVSFFQSLILTLNLNGLKEKNVRLGSVKSQLHKTPMHFEVHLFCSSRAWDITLQPCFPVRHDFVLPSKAVLQRHINIFGASFVGL